MGLLPRDRAELMVRQLLQPGWPAPREVFEVALPFLNYPNDSGPFKEFIQQRASEVFEDPIALDADRLGALQVFADHEPKTLWHLLDSDAASRSPKVKDEVARMAAWHLILRPDAYQDAPARIEHLATFMRSSGNAQTRKAVVAYLSKPNLARKLRKIQELEIQAALVSVSVQAGVEDVRVAAIEALASAKYVTAADALEPLTRDPSAKVAAAAQAAIEDLKQ